MRLGHSHAQKAALLPIGVPARVELQRAQGGQRVAGLLPCAGRLAHPPAKARDRALDTTRGHMSFAR